MRPHLSLTILQVVFKSSEAYPCLQSAFGEVFWKHCQFPIFPVGALFALRRKVKLPPALFFDEKHNGGQFDQNYKIFWKQ